MKWVVAIALVLLLTLSLLPLPLLGKEPLAGLSRPPAATGILPIDRIVVTPDQTADGRVQVRVALGDGEVLTLPLDKYPQWVVVAEMPISFEPETLKAQTMAVHTYTLSRTERIVEAHPDASVCTGITCCRAYVDSTDATANWGENAQTCTGKAVAAVADTDDMVAPFQGQPIQTVFFSPVAGRTMDAMEVWDNVMSYLTSMDSPEGGEVPNYHSAVMVPPDEFKSRLLAQYLQADLSGEPAGRFANLAPSSADKVETVDIGDTIVGGGSLCTLFGLCSTGFTVSASVDGVTFSITGYGHGMGMSQYGVSALTRGGKSYGGTLKWYYTGVDMAPYMPQR